MFDVFSSLDEYIVLSRRLWRGLPLISSLLPFACVFLSSSRSFKQAPLHLFVIDFPRLCRAHRILNLAHGPLNVFKRLVECMCHEPHALSDLHEANNSRLPHRCIETWCGSACSNCHKPIVTEEGLGGGLPAAEHLEHLRGGDGAT